MSSILVGCGRREIRTLDTTSRVGCHLIDCFLCFVQADVEVIFSFSSLDKAEAFDPSWVDAQAVCSQLGSTAQGGVGPFGLLTLASENLEEFTPVFFRIFKAEPNKHVVLMCSDARR